MKVMIDAGLIRDQILSVLLASRDTVCTSNCLITLFLTAL